MMKKNKIESYYSGNYYGMPSAHLLYKLSNELNKESSDLLWLSIVGSVDHYINSHLTQEQYETFYYESEKQARILNLHNGYNQKPRKTIIKTEENGGKEEEIQPETENRLPKCIFTESDCKLFLYKYWNLYDSFMLSDFTVSNLLTWKEQGKDEVNKILALIGIPTYEAKQKYIYMKMSLKSLFKRKLPEITNKLLKGFMFESFNFQFDEITQMSAGDFVSCMNALLNNPFSNETFHYNEEEESTENGIVEVIKNAADADKLNINSKKKLHEDLTKPSESVASEIPKKNGLLDENDTENLNSDKKNKYYENFWLVYNFLSLKCTKLLPLAIEKAIEFQKAFVSLGTSIIDRNFINSSNTFRYAILGDLSDQIKYVTNPLSLERFGILVLNIYENLKKLNKGQFVAKPLVLGVLNNDHYLVAGISLKNKENEEEKNIFPFRFKLSANKIKAKILLSSFNDSIVEIRKDDLLSFLDALLGDD